MGRKSERELVSNLLGGRKVDTRTLSLSEEKMDFVDRRRDPTSRTRTFFPDCFSIRSTIVLIPTRILSGGHPTCCTIT